MAFEVRIWPHVGFTVWDPARPVAPGSTVKLIGGPVGDTDMFAAGTDNYEFTSSNPVVAGNLRQLGTRNAVHWDFRLEDVGTYTFTFRARQHLPDGSGGWASDTVTLRVEPIPTDVAVHMAVEGAEWSPHRPVPANRSVRIDGYLVDPRVELDGDDWEFTLSPPVPGAAAPRRATSRTVVWFLNYPPPGRYTATFRAKATTSDTWREATMAFEVAVPPHLAIDLVVQVNGAPWDGEAIEVGARVRIDPVRVSGTEPFASHRWAPDPRTLPAIDAEPSPSGAPASLTFTARLPGRVELAFAATDPSGTIATDAVWFDVVPSHISLDVPSAGSSSASEPMAPEDPTVIDVRGRWYDEGGGLVVDIRQDGDQLRIELAGRVLEGGISDRELRARDEYSTEADVPRAVADIADQLVGDAMTFEATVAPGALQLDATIRASARLPDLRVWSFTLVRVPVVEGLFVVSDDLGALIEEADLDFPWSDPTLAELRRPHHDFVHTLLVWGHNLPPEDLVATPSGLVGPKGYPAGLVTSRDPTLTYEPVGSWAGHQTPSPWTSGAAAEALDDHSWDVAWRRLSAELGSARAAEIAALDPILLRAWPNSGGTGTFPGDKTLTLRGASLRWRLERPVVRGDVFLARWPYGEAANRLDHVVPNSRVVVEIQPQVPLGVDEVEVRLVLLPDGEEPAAPVVITARRIEDRVYQTGPVVLYLTAAPPLVPRGSVVLPAVPGDRLAIEFDSIHIGGPLVVAVVDQPPVASVDWYEQLRRAAAVHGIQASDFRDVADQPVAQLDYTVVLAGPPHVNTVDVTLAHHAGALVLRDELVRQLRAYVALIEGHVLGDPLALEAMARAVAPWMADEAYPLGSVEVDSPAGDVPLRRGFDLRFQRRTFGSRAEVTEWLARSLQTALEELLTAMRDALQRAEDTPDDELEDLLELTGLGLGAVRDRARPMLLRRPNVGLNDDTRWISDRDARRAVSDIQDLARSMKDFDALSEADTNVLLAIAGLIPLAWPLGLARTVYWVLLGLVEATRIATTWYDEVRELDFAAGAAPVIGTERWRVADAESLPWWAHVLSLIVVVGGTAFAVATDLRAAAIAAARSEAPRLAASFEAGGVDAFHAMSETDKAHFLVGMIEARVLQDVDGAALTTLQRRMAGVAREFEERAARYASTSRLSQALQDTPADLSGSLPSTLRNQIPCVRDPRLLGDDASRSFVDFVLGDTETFVEQILVRVGRDADPAVLRNHEAALDAMMQYKAFSDDLAGAGHAVARFEGTYGSPRKGSLPWVVDIELTEMPYRMMEDRLLRILSGTLDPADSPALVSDLCHLVNRSDYYRRLLDDMAQNPLSMQLAAEFLPYEAHLAVADDAMRQSRAAFVAVRDDLADAYRIGGLQELTGAVHEQVYQATLRSAVLQTAGDSAEALARTQAALRRYFDTVPADLHDVFLRVPGVSDLLAEVARGGRGAPFHLRLLVAYARAGRVARVIEDTMPGPLRYSYRQERVVGGHVRAAADAILLDGELVQAKSFENLGSALNATRRQAMSDVIRYADQRGVTSTGHELNGLMSYWIDGQRLRWAVSAGWDEHIQATSRALTQWARAVAGPHLPNQPTIRIGVLP